MSAWGWAIDFCCKERWSQWSVCRVCCFSHSLPAEPESSRIPDRKTFWNQCLPASLFGSCSLEAEQAESVISNWRSAQILYLNCSFPVFLQWRCTESHPSTTWQSSPAQAAARPPRAGAPRQCSTGAKPWARTSRRSPAAKPRPGVEPRKPYLQQSVNPSRRLPLTSSSGLATMNHT